MEPSSELTTAASTATATEGVVSLDGHVVAAAQATISALDAAVLHGDSYFETMRAEAGRPLLAEQHLVRLRAAVEQAGYAQVPGDDRLREWIDATIAASGLASAIVRLTVSRGVRPRLLGSPPSRATCMVHVLPLPERALADPPAPLSVTVAQCPGYRFPRKSGSYQRNVELYETARAAGFDEALIADGESVIEGSGTNVFALCGGELVTPRSDRCLAGVIRALLLDAAPGLNLRPVERDLKVGELPGVDSLLVTNSLIGVRAVDRIDANEIEVDEPVLAALRSAVAKAEAAS